MPFYDPATFYPAGIGQVIHDRYQVVAKLGYGTTATTWLCHDLVHRHYVTLKIHVTILPHVREVDVFRHLKTFESEHEGRNHIRMVDDSFKIKGPHGTHEVLVLPPMSLSLRALQDKMPSGVFDVELARAALPQVLLALDFLHGVANVVHNVHAGNLLVGISDDSYLEQFAEAELTRPSARKQHRAPEILLDMGWNWAIDMWSIGILNEAHHLADMVSLLGPPPLDLLKRSDKSRKYWDADGTWRGVVAIPESRTLESLVTTMDEGPDRDQFVDFVQSLLRWIPEKRPSTAAAYYHPWLGKSPDVANTEE
ncbi:kinase-like protein [Lasiosphaeria ovina]|uniref:non-specific serine/threonine protein kinase n=1 Tax=Lasiosphaeria ovina TaxID=92902 RepID=A0AAE0N9G3_9PEZI|nr:kinase-like protein [Lasiosphaeria ovina]